jgi:hypothetical protein
MFLSKFDKITASEIFLLNIKHSKGILNLTEEVSEVGPKTKSLVQPLIDKLPNPSF